MRYVALLRAVNLGGNTTVRMGELREVLGAAGFENVATYLQSGNVALDWHDDDEVDLGAALEEAVAAHWGRNVPVVVRSSVDLAALVTANPYPHVAEADPTRVHVTFFDRQPPPEAWDGVDLNAVAPDEFTVGDRAVYLHLPDGMGRARLPDALARLKLPVVATTRNWRTVTNLLALAERT